MKVDPKKLLVIIPDTRGVTVSPYGGGNLKLGLNVYTYSRLPGSPARAALGMSVRDEDGYRREFPVGTCPGASEECQAICYAARPVTEQGVVYDMWRRNSETESVPPIPDDCKILRLHVSGDFTTADYIDGWIVRLKQRPDVTAWAYTRSWRVAALLPALERLRALPNVQLFASMDKSITEVPPAGWRRAWIDGDERAGQPWKIAAHQESDATPDRNPLTFDGTRSLICPEETKHQPDCESCGYCFRGQRNDVTFLKH